MKKIISLVLVLLLGLATVSPATEDTWTYKADMPTARFLHSSSVVEGLIYAIGGCTSEPNPQVILPVDVYDPVTDSWTQKADMITGRAVLSTCEVDGKIYAIGGAGTSLVGLATVEMYDPATDTWIAKADMPTSRAALAVCTVAGKIYAIGGTRNLTNLSGLSTVEEYDPATDTWVTKAGMPTRRLGLCTAVVDGQIIAIGGSTQNPAVPTVEAYDPATDTWTSKTDMPTARRNFATSVVNGKIYAIGGWVRSSYYAFRTVEQYDSAIDVWTEKTDLPLARSCLSASTVNGRIYAIGGTDKSHPCPALSTVYEYDPFPLVVDFNGDFKVNIEDLVILIENWGTDDPMCDIAPRPFGDGIVEELDLELFMSYWEQEILPVELIAYWKLDETEGDIANDSAGENDADLFGDPIWRPTDGMVDGALMLDGIDDLVATWNIPNLSAGQLSVFAWVKGGAPGQVVVSQCQGVNWLMADASQGYLKTDLKGSGRIAQSLVSEVTITDGNWHRVGLTWDGTNRILYVDNVAAVASDTQSDLDRSAMGLNIGCGPYETSGTFFAGLIDDVRIYNRAITP